MDSIFAAKKSGMASMLESMLPPDVMEAIRVAKEQMPQVIATVQAAVIRIEGTLNAVDCKLDMLHTKVDKMRLDFDLTAIPETLPSQIAEMENGIPNGELNMVHLTPDKQEIT